MLKAAAFISTFYFVAVLGATFMLSLPKWCGEPEVGVNFVVIPLCR